MSDPLKIILDRLKGDKKEILEGEYSFPLLEKEENSCRVEPKVWLKLEAYLASDVLILHFDAKVTVELPCNICNNPTSLKVKVENGYFTQPLEEIKDYIFDVKPAIRESLLLEIPQFIECSKGKCPEREEIASYLKEPESEKKEEENFPFSDLDQELGEDHGST